MSSREGVLDWCPVLLIAAHRYFGDRTLLGDVFARYHFLCDEIFIALFNDEYTARVIRLFGLGAPAGKTLHIAITDRINQEDIPRLQRTLRWTET